MQGLAQAERLYDSRLPEAILVAVEDDNIFNVPTVRVISESDVEKLIAELAHTGEIPDIFGQFTSASDINHAIAKQWIADKEAVGSIIGPVFWRWAKACTYLAMGVA